ncbi:uncharacterized protein A4U43_C09F8190 [Asparagus officinalis]|uniref:Uncharacterized protein n=1 Tax=Asparagus officinalis TaxID=4686 RepID=A0A5P1E9F7_ASPOF|nr:uncharacterized protein A4U43_C09F8190 [Asparagus officinalis]
MGDLAAKLGVGRRPKGSSTRCHDSRVVAQASRLTRIGPFLEQNLPEEQSVIWADEVDTVVRAATGVIGLAPMPKSSHRMSKELAGLVGETAKQATFSSQPRAKEANEYCDVIEKERGGESEFSEGADEETTTVLPLAGGGTETSAMLDPSTNTDVQGQEDPAFSDTAAPPPDDLASQEK